MEVLLEVSSRDVESLVKEPQSCGSCVGRAVEITAVALLALSLLAMGIFALLIGFSVLPGGVLELSSGLSLSSGAVLIALSGVSLFSLYLLAPSNKKSTVEMPEEEVVQEEESSSPVEEEQVDVDPLEGIELKSVTVEQLKSSNFSWERLSEEQVDELFPMDGDSPFVVFSTQRRLKDLEDNNIARWAPLLSGEQLRLLSPEQLSCKHFPWDKLHEDQGKELFPIDEFTIRNVTLHKLKALRSNTIDFLKEKGWITEGHLKAMRGVSTT